MPGTRRPRARITGADRASALARAAGAEIRSSRLRRNLTQKTLAAKVGISRPRLADIEGGRGSGAPLETWFALSAELGRFLRFEMARDPLEQPTDAGHLDIQRLVLRIAREAGYDERQIEMPNRRGSRWTDVAIVKRAARILVLVECVNTFGDVGGAFRSHDRKLADARDLAVALGGDDGPFDVRSCWVVRDSARNRAVVAEYTEVFETRFPGSSLGWVRALTRGDPMPVEPALIWCDLAAAHLFARRPPRAARPRNE